MPSPYLNAVAFDAYGTLFDVYSVGALAAQLFPEKGAELTHLWRLKQIEYTQLRSLAGRYKPFWDVTQEALVFCARSLGLDLTAALRERLMNQYACLAAFPENVSALRQLKALGISTAILSNGTPRMLEIAVKSAGMTGLFDHLLSVEAVKKYKPAPEVYQLGTAAFGRSPAQILFVSSNGWDIAGATWFGFSTFWINRSGQPFEELDATPSATGATLNDVVTFLRSKSGER